MKKSLLLSSSSIFEDANTVDCIRQTCIDLKKSPKNEDLKIFLKESIKYLKEDIPFDIFNELLAAIISCFSINPAGLSKYFNHFLKRGKQNSNYLIVTASILSYLIHVEPPLTLPDYQSFIDDCMTEIIPQIKKNDADLNLEIFGHKISPLYETSFIVDILLSSNLTEKFFLTFFPYLFSHKLLSDNPKFNFLLENVSKSGVIHILKQNSKSNEEISQFISNNGYQSLLNHGEESNSLIESVLIYIKCQDKKKMKGIKKETILQFLSVLIIIIKNYKIQEKVSFSSKSLLDLLIEGVKFLPNFQSKVFNESVDLIVKNYFYINATLSIPSDALINIFEIILKQIASDVYPANKLIFFHTLFDLFDKIKYYNFRNEIQNFLKTNSNLIVQSILKNLDEINLDYQLKIKKFDFKYFDPNLFIYKLPDYQYFSQLIYFLDNSCANLPIDNLKNTSARLSLNINMKIKEEKWDELIKISKFFKKYNLNDAIQPLQTNRNVPNKVKEELFGCSIESNDSIDNIIYYLLTIPNPEQDDSKFKLLFDQIVTKHKELFEIYLTFIFAKYDSNLTFNINTFITFFINEYEKYGKDMMDVFNKIFVYKVANELLLYKLDFVLEKKEIPDSINNIISHLFDAIENKKGNYQAFYCLMNIAQSFPTLFYPYSRKMFYLAYCSFDFLFLIFEKKEDDEHLPLIKTGYSALLLILASLRSPKIIDEYFKWIFCCIEKLSHIQILCTFIILNALNSDNRILNLSLIFVIKYNFLETIAKFLKRNIEECYFLSCYKSNIYKYITDIYSCYSRCNMYIIAQNEELMKKENPFSFAFNEIFIKTPYINIGNINIEANSTQLDQFIKNASKLRDFWISYKFERRNKTPYESKIAEFISNIGNKSSSSVLYSYPALRTPITFHMSKYLTMQKIWAYSDLLYSVLIPHTKEMFNYLNQIIIHLNKLRDYADNHPNENDEIDDESFSVIDYFLPQYCQDSLIKNLISDLYLPSLNLKCFSSLCELFVSYTSNNIGLLNFLSVISQSFSDIYEKCIGFAPHSLLKVMCNLIEILEKMTDVNGFKENFFETCGNNLINIVLCPELRNDLVLLLKVSNLLKEFDPLPIRVTQIIYFMLISNNEKVVSAAISLSSKFSHDQLSGLNQFILAIFDMEIKNEKRLSMISTLVKYSSVVLDERESQIHSILKGLFKNFTIQKNEKIIDLMCSIMNKLAPHRTNFDNISPASAKITEIPQYIKETNPKFWNLFEKYIEPFNKMINENLGYLSQFKFLFEYPELVSFKTRSIYFRKKMKEMINYNDELVLHIDLNNILMSSYYRINDETTENLLKKIYVIFGTNTKTIDYGGPTREFLTKLAKEIFNVKYGLFEISNNMTYQPSKVSYIQNDYLKHFRFAGIFVARALIEGQCIDAHLTTSFLKQILHLKPSLKDLEDFDEQLFNSLNWMLNNDVDSLDMYFEIGYEEFGVHKTISLIENGSQIKVTNENKKEFIELNSQFYKKKIEDQVKAFCDGFDSLIPHEKINYFSPKELDLLICGVTDIDVEDFIENTVFETPLSKYSPIVKMFFNVIRSWDNEKLSKLLFFMTGSPRVPANGFKEFVQITGFPLRIEAGGDENALPQAHTCFNTIDLPSYRSEKELNDKLLYAIQECNTFELL